jgi:tRNA dimethylallyltransferase
MSMVRPGSWTVSSTSSSIVSGPTPWRAAWRGRGTTAELPPLVIVAGPTATGKTSLAIELARRLPGSEIVSADSRQVYRGMDIGTAKATAEERAAAPHHGLDLVDPDVPFTVSDYRRAALSALRGIAARGGLAFLVGGTGLYLRAVGRGLPLDTPAADAHVRATLETRLHDEGLPALVVELAQRDPVAAARIDLRNPRRVVRALERFVVTGSGLPPPPTGYPGPSMWLGLDREPVEHRALITARVAEQFRAGLLEEAEDLRSRYPEDLPAFSAMGYREAFDVLAGRCSVESAAARDVQRTWGYARRQRTWFRAEPEVHWLAAGEGLIERAWTELEPFLRTLRSPGYAGSR